ncbi:MAG: glycosyltransferase family 4 protein [Phycisphaeraceae bacterium]
MTPTIDILLCQRFLPEFGGSIRWMHEVYRRWPGPGAVEVITHDYYGHPPRTPEFPDAPQRPASGDHVTAPNLRMDRRDIFMRDWGLESIDRLRRYFRMTRAVRQRLKRNPKAIVRVHCIHAVPELASLLPLLPLYRKRLRLICYAHGEEVTACASSRQLTMLMKRAYRAADLVIANSRYTASVLEKHVGSKNLAGKVRVVNPGVELGEFVGAAEAGRAWRQEQGLGDRPVVLTVGRLDPRKNHAAVIEALGQLREAHPDAAYYIAGQGRHKAALEALAAKLNIADRVVFSSNVDGKLKLAMYGGCDVFAMPAIRDGTDVEGFGMVFLEAGACGKASLAGREGGQADAVIDGQTGLVVDGTDQPAVTDSLHKLLSDAALRRRLGDGGREYARQFDWSCIVQRTLELVDLLGT